MYTPPKFCKNDPDKLFSIISENSFALVLSVNGEGEINHTQTPLIVSEGRTKLLGHIAKANPHWYSWSNTPVKAIFQGAHTYISPKYYESEFNVPTWNYQTVSVEGLAQVISDPNIQTDIMQALVSRHESGFEQSWEFDPDDSRYKKLFEMIVFFEIEITDIQASFKLNQNKPKDDQMSVITHLKKIPQLSHNQLIAKAMEENLKL